jgi:hypothetical protein
LGHDCLSSVRARSDDSKPALCTLFLHRATAVG